MNNNQDQRRTTLRPPPPQTRATEPPKLKTSLMTTPATKQNVHEPARHPEELQKICRGECVSGLFALFCDDVDSDATCPGGASCCITNSESSSSEVVQQQKIPVTTTNRPTTQVYSPQNLLLFATEFLKNYQSSSSQAYAPRCPGFCLLNIMTAFCERPSVLIPHTSNCKKGSVCCDNTRTVPTLKPRPPPTRKATAPPPPPPSPPAETTEKPDPRIECPGSCIVPLLSFTCFRNAELTDLFKCKKSGTQCCAPKTKIQEIQDAMGKNGSYPLDYKQSSQPPYVVNGMPGGSNVASSIGKLFRNDIILDCDSSKLLFYSSSGSGQTLRMSDRIEFAIGPIILSLSLTMENLLALSGFLADPCSHHYSLHPKNYRFLFKPGKSKEILPKIQTSRQ